MDKKKIDLSDIKKNDLDTTSTFSDLMTRSERNYRKRENASSDDIDDMVNEKRKSTRELTQELKKAKDEYNKQISTQNIKAKEDEIEENLGKTQIMELTRQMKFNFQEIKEENTKKKKYGFSPLNLVGELNLLCMGYYIYLLAFTNYQDIEFRYMLNGGIIISMVLLFGLSVVSGKKISKIFYILNILSIILFVIYNVYTIFN